MNIKDLNDINEDRTATADEWFQKELNGCTIIDADGFDRGNFQYSYFEEKITRREFYRRINDCTILVPNDVNLVEER